MLVQISGKIIACCERKRSCVLAGKRRVAVKVSESGHLVADSHPKARLTQHDVDLIRDIYEAQPEVRGGKHKGRLGYSALARKFGVSMWTIRDIVNYRTWVSTPTLKEVIR